MAGRFIVVSPVLKDFFLQDEVISVDQIGPRQETERLVSIGALRPFGLDDRPPGCQMLDTLIIPTSMDSFADWLASTCNPGKVMPAAFRGDVGWCEFPLAEGIATTGKMGGAYPTSEGYR